MRQPRTALPLVDPESLQALVEIDCQTRCSATLVLEHEHADAPRLAVALDGEGRRFGCNSGRPQFGSDRVQLARADYEMNWNLGVPGGAVMVGPTLRVDLEIQAVRQPEDQ